MNEIILNSKWFEYLYQSLSQFAKGSWVAFDFLFDPLKITAVNAYCLYQYTMQEIACSRMQLYVVYDFAFSLKIQSMPTKNESSTWEKPNPCPSLSGSCCIRSRLLCTLLFNYVSLCYTHKRTRSLSLSHTHTKIYSLPILPSWCPPQSWSWCRRSRCCYSWLSHSPGLP